MAKIASQEKNFLVIAEISDTVKYLRKNILLKNL